MDGHITDTSYINILLANKLNYKRFAWWLFWHASYCHFTLREKRKCYAL